MLLDSVNPPPKGDLVYIRLPKRDSGYLSKFKEAAEAHPGNTPVCLYFEAEKQKLMAPKNLYIDSSESTILALKSTFGDKNIVKK